MKIIYLFLIFSVLIISCNKKEDSPTPNLPSIDNTPNNSDTNNSNTNNDIPNPSTNTSQQSSTLAIVTIGVFGDLNGGIGDLNYANTVKIGVPYLVSHSPDIILGSGDYVGGEDYRNTLSNRRFVKMWKLFDDKILKQFKEKNIPFAPTPGNHDANMARERTHYQTFWNNNFPNVQMISSEMYPFYYSYSFKGIFFISMDDVRTDKLRDRTFEGVTQKEWIIQQLSSVQAKNSIARIVYGHVPIYPVLSKRKHAKKNRGKYYEILTNEQQNRSKNSLEKILKDGNVSLAIFGHSHAYYPAVIQHKNERIDQSLNVLSMACLGYGNRYLDARTKKRSQRGFGIIKIDLNKKQMSYNIYNYNNEIIPMNSLPSKISPYKNVDLRRWDTVYLNNFYQL